MNTYLALFRGINIGGKHLLPMQELVKLLADMGCEHIKTYGQSGNVVFRTTANARAKLAADISRKILKVYGFEPKVILIDESALQEAIDNTPFATDNAKALHLFFLATPPASPDLARLLAIKSGTEEFKLINGTFYLFTPDGVGRSRLPASIERCLGVTATARNWNTVRKLLTMIKQV